MLINWKELKKDQFQDLADSALVAVNFASIEQHSKHLPVGTDAYLGEAVLNQAAKLASSKILVLPQVTYGYSPHHKFAKGFVTIPQSILISYACEICRCVYENGFKKLFLLNSHGGNQVYLSAVVNEMGEMLGRDFSLIELRVWDIAEKRIARIRESELGGMAHAGEFETSMMLYLYPDLVNTADIPVSDPAPGNPWYHRDLFGYKKYQKFMNFNEINKEGHIGQPHLASSEKGRLLFEAVSEELARFFDSHDQL